ncbi:MAG TPA: hypothetical protein VLX92_05590 [Kofleriaceae bacterium]|nr:hypothetical protein [Kofleriaceae bacterium]
MMRIAAVGGGLAAAGCGHHGQMIVDTPITPYQKPDISEITGIDEDDDSGSGSAAAPGSAAVTPPAK